jgi:hypothetical protein
MTVSQRISQLAFNAGEWGPDLDGRIDLAKYAMAARYIINRIPAVQGKLERRPGTAYIADVKDHANPPRIIDFVYNDVQSYIVELGDEYARFFMLGGQLAQSGAPYEIATPYAVEDLNWLQVAQRSDTMFIAGGAKGYAPSILQRSAHTSWSIPLWNCDTGPFNDVNDTSTTITPSATSGSVTLTASASLFATGHAPDGGGLYPGALFRIEEDSTDGYSMWEPAKSYNSNDVVRYGTNVYQQVSGSTKTSGSVAPVHLTGDRFDGQASSACKWRYLHSGYGIVRITAVTNATTATATVLSLLPSTSAVRNWREGAFSAYRGWPVAVTLFQQSLYWGGSKSYPRRIWRSVGGNPFDFTPGALADDAMFFDLEGRDANPIRALSEGDALYAHTARRVHRISGTNNGPIKPDDRIAPVVGGVGSNGVQPVNVGRAILFPDQSGRRFQELAYDEAAGNSAARDLSRIATHILRPGS